MTTPRRFAALAVCLLALAAGASAQGACDLIKGYFSMELVSVTGTNADSSELAKCLSSVKVSLDTDCKLTLDSYSAGGSFLPAIFTDTSLATLTYDQFKECPATSKSAVTVTTPAVSGAFATPGSLDTALLTQLAAFAYEGARATPGLTHIQVANGVVTVQNNVDPQQASIVYKYAIKQVTMTVSGVVTATGTDLTAGTEYLTNANIGNTCGNGKYGLVVGSIKICYLCPAGTSGDGYGCTSCDGGKYSGVGATSCGSCTDGTYAQGGNSDCLPCPAGTYGVGAISECSECPLGSYSWIPGSAGCYKCFDGVPKCVAGKEGSTACVADLTDPSPGYHVLSVGTLAWPAGLVTAYKPAAVGQCGTWDDTTPALQLALEVAADCSMTIKPITDTLCSDPGAVNGQQIVGAAVGTTYNYTYNDLTIRAYYQTSTSIRTLLPTDPSTTVKSFLMAIDQPTTLSGNNLRLRFWGATDNVAASDLTADVSDTTVTTVGGSVAGLPAKASAIGGASCPTGTYASGDNYCAACPQGYFCTAGQKTACNDDYANPYLGATASAGYCTQCNAGLTPRYTSYAGAGYCTLPYFERNCATAGTYWDESTMKCELCAAGTFRAASNATHLECEPCPPGTYSPAGAASCTACPAGQYNPSSGLADQSATTGVPTLHCLRCPLGSVAMTQTEAANLKVDNSVLTTTDDYRNNKALPGGATTCVACPDGTYAIQANTEKLPTVTGTAPNLVYTNEATSCSLCPSDTYRTGDASPQNNVCKPIPAGYKAKTLLVPSAAIGVSPDDLVCDGTETTAAKCKGAWEIEACSRGTVSSWDSGFTTRAPLAPTVCALCTKNEYAPRPGMAKCIQCKGGFVPYNTGTNGAAGPDACQACAAGLYRSFYSLSASCTICPAGSEVGPSSRQACTQCRPGHFKVAAGDVDDSDNCSKCPTNSYMARTGATACVACPRGYETQDEGNTECSPCPVGYYNKATATLGAAPACAPAPAGTFTNTSAAYFTTACPLGTFTDKEGQDSCDPCPPGQYANALGSKSCKTCPAGTFSIGQASTCRSCTAGFYAPAGSGSCSPCKPGTFTDAARAGTCKLCPKGKQCPTPATKAPQDCPAGYFSAKDGSTLCTPCPVNFYQTARGQTKCLACAAGTNTRGLRGQTKCQTVRVTSLRRSVL